MWILCLIFGLALVLSGGAYLGTSAYKFVKDESRDAFDKKENQYALFSYGALAVGGGLLQAAINMGNSWGMNALQAFLSVFGAGLFFLSLGGLIANFYLRYYKVTAREDQAKWYKRILFLSIAGVILAILIAGEGVAPFLEYPLVNGIAFNNAGVHLTSPTNSYAGGLHITFYGILIVLGAYTAYAISDHKMYQKFGVHGILDSTLLVAFPGGIIGARIGYVIGNWNGDAAGGMNFSQEVANGNWGSIFAIWNGGLTILGGAIGGILVGATFIFLKRRSIGVLTAVDVCVPTILWGQILGRWGNFFNKEVYGASVPGSSMSFLPTWIANQMADPSKVGNIFVPLFLIEALLNIVGYFLIVYGVGKLLKKWLVRGDLGGCYMIWYGIVRLIMEPMRDPEFNMGTDGNWSIIWAILYIVIGVLFIAGLHIFDYFYHTKGGHPRMVPSYKGVKEYQWTREKAVVSISVDQKAASTNTTPADVALPGEAPKGEDVPLSESKDEPLPLDKQEEK